MSISRERLDVGQFHRDGRRWATLIGPIGLLLLAGLAMTFSAVGCGEKSLPAATRAVDEASAPVGAPSAVKNTTDPAAAARPQPLRNITFDTVKLNMKKGDPFRSELLTPEVKKLDGNRVRIRGFILPPPQQNGLTRFVLVRDNMACCFGPGAAIYDSMIVQMKPGLSMDYSVQPIMVEGTFNIHEVDTPDGRCLSIYHMTADKAE
jgi:hypothetical protein